MTVFYINICSFPLRLFYRCILLHQPIYGVTLLRKRTEAILEYYFWF